MNEDFQTWEVRKYAEAIYNWLEGKLVEAVIEYLWLEETYTDEEWNKMPVSFDYAFKVLQEQGATLNHTIVENDWKATLKINFYKKDKEISYDIKTAYSISVTK